MRLERRFIALRKTLQFVARKCIYASLKLLF